MGRTYFLNMALLVWSFGSLLKLSVEKLSGINTSLITTDWLLGSLPGGNRPLLIRADSSNPSNSSVVYRSTPILKGFYTDGGVGAHHKVGCHRTLAITPDQQWGVTRQEVKKNTTPNKLHHIENKQHHGERQATRATTAMLPNPASRERTA